jgi:hypothetical protein
MKKLKGHGAQATSGPHVVSMEQADKNFYFFQQKKR